jgi:hypothetical protein
MNLMISLDCGVLLPDKNYDHLRADSRPLTWAMTSLIKQRWYGEEDKNEIQ